MILLVSGIAADSGKSTILRALAFGSLLAISPRREEKKNGPTSTTPN
jgi:hypothetical protein